MREVGIDICAETPKTLTVDAVRPIRDAIEKRVRDLIADVTRD